jgi:hypothetical protein
MDKQFENSIAILDHNLLFYTYFNALGENAEELRNKLTKSFIRNFLSILTPPVVFHPDKSVEILNQFLASCENEIRLVVSGHNAYYWLYVYRRILPANTFFHGRIASVALYRETMEAAFLKYGLAPIDKDLFVPLNEAENLSTWGGELFRVAKDQFGEEKALTMFERGRFEAQICVKEFSLDHFIELLSLERLCCEYTSILAGFRRACKGGKLIIEDIESYYVQNDEEDDELINTFDDRNEKDREGATSLGVPSLNLKDNKEDLKCLLPIYNIELTTWKEYPIHRFFQIELADEEQAPNFLMAGPFNLTEYLARNSFLADDFHEHFGFKIELLVLFIYYLSNNALSSARGDAGRFIQLVQRAYVHYQACSQLISDSVNFINHRDGMLLGEIKTNETEINKIIDLLELRSDSVGGISLSSRGPRKAFIRTFDNALLFDYAALPNILMTVTHILREESKRKGQVFEDYVASRVGKGELLWGKQKIVKADDGTEREIDLAYVIKHVLIVCELKCVNRSFAFEKGEKTALEFRQSKMIDALKQADEKVAWLSERPKGTNYTLPEGVKLILPVVVSPFIEYIWSRNEYLWITDEIPRVCSTSELQNLVSNVDKIELNSKSYVRYVV